MHQLLLRTLVAITLTLGGCDSAPPPVASNSGPSTELLLQPGEGVRGALRLTAAKRDQHIGECEGSGHITFHPDAYSTPERSSSARNTIRRYCDCLINRLEDRANKLEFTLIMAAIRAKGLSGNLRQRLEPAHEGRSPKYITDAAIADGFTHADYFDVVRSVPRLGEAAVQHCGG
jgi:hypothetical protein